MCKITTVTGEPVRLLKEPTTTKELRDAVAKALAIPPIQVVLWCPELKRLLKNTDTLPFHAIVHRKPLHSTVDEVLSHVHDDASHVLVVRREFRAPPNIPLLQRESKFSYETTVMNLCIQSARGVLFRIQFDCSFRLELNASFIGASRCENNAHVLDFPQGFPMLATMSQLEIHFAFSKSPRKGRMIGGFLSEAQAAALEKNRKRYVPMSGHPGGFDQLVVKKGRVQPRTNKKPTTSRVIC